MFVNQWSHVNHMTRVIALGVRTFCPEAKKAYTPKFCRERAHLVPRAPLRRCILAPAAFNALEGEVTKPRGGKCASLNDSEQTEQA